MDGLQPKNLLFILKLFNVCFQLRNIVCNIVQQKDIGQPQKEKRGQKALDYGKLVNPLVFLEVIGEILIVMACNIISPEKNNDRRDDENKYSQFVNSIYFHKQSSLILKTE